MPPATDQQLDRLAPYIAGARPDSRGELEMFCPIHPDTRRSASLNLEMGVWYCHAGCGGGSLSRLLDAEDTWVPADNRIQTARPIVASAPPTGELVVPSVTDCQGWHRRLRRDRGLRRQLRKRRGLTIETIRKARLGHSGRWYKIPVFDPNRQLWNVRTYDMNVNGDRRKIWSVRGMGQPRLYPVGVLERAEPGSAILWCEGEWDTLLALQSGYQAVTRTGSALDWRPEWLEYFADLRVFMCQDRDVKGEAGTQKISAELAKVVTDIRFCQLPYPVTEKHGKDLTDFLMNADDPGLELGQLMDDATPEQEG